MKVLLRNKKVHLKYEILETYTAGISLTGGEVKSVKNSHGSMDGSYVTVTEKDSKYQILLRNVSIPPYQAGNIVGEYNTERPRVLLLEKKEIHAITKQLHVRGITIVPIVIGLEHGKIKVEIAVVRGKKKYDKRQDIKKRDQNRDAERDSKVRFK